MLLLMRHHPDVLRLQRAPMRRRIRGAIGVALVGLGCAAAAPAREAPSVCPGVPPSCHIRQHPECVCSGPSATQCKWMCVWEAKGATR